MSPLGVDLEVLKRKAMLLLRRERELSQFRLERARTEAWLGVFHALSLELQGHDDRALIERWAALLVEDLGFQIAGAYRRDPSDPRYVLACSEPPSRLGAAVRVGLEASAILEALAGGRYQFSDAEAPMQQLGRDLGLGKFHWLHLPLDGRAVLLVAGCSPEAAPFHELTDVDHAQFVLLGNHLGALLKSVRLTVSLSKERTELQRSNEELESANARTRAEMNERLALEKKVRHAQKLEALGRLTAGISHEVNNPLSCVLSNLRFCVEAIDDLHRELPGGGVAELRAAAADALDGAERIGRIVRDVMQFARAEDARLTSVDVRRALDVATHVCRNEIVRHARLLTDYQEVAPVHADAQRLQQVFVNLLTNAAQAMNDRPGGTIRIVMRGEAGQICVEVHDEGSGIPAEIADHVCDPFFTTRPVGKGTGLGLWVCRNILETFGGRLELGRSASGGTMARAFLQAAGPQPRSTAAGDRATAGDG